MPACPRAGMPGACARRRARACSITLWLRSARCRREPTCLSLVDHAVAVASTPAAANEHVGGV
jgi:hypothetical protein